MRLGASRYNKEGWHGAAQTYTWHIALGTVWFGTRWHSVALRGTVQPRVARFGTAERSLAQRTSELGALGLGTAQHSLAWHGSARSLCWTPRGATRRVPPSVTRYHAWEGMGDATLSGPRPVPRDVTPRPPGSSDSLPLCQNGCSSGSELSPRHRDLGHPTLPDVPTVPVPLLAVPVLYPFLPSPSHHVEPTLGKEMSCQGGMSVTGFGDGVPHKAVPQGTPQVTQLSLLTAQVPPGCAVLLGSGSLHPRVPPPLGSGTSPHLPAGETEAPGPYEPPRLGRTVLFPPS